MFSTIVFDFDGTLVDSNELKRAGFLQVAAQHVGGMDCMSAVLDRVKGDRRAVFEAYAAAIEDTGSAEPRDVANLVAAYSNQVDAAVATAPEMPGATRALQELSQRGLSIHISSATPLASLQRIVESRAWMPWVSGLFGSPGDKAETLRHLLQSRGLAPSALAVVGDGADDRASAAAVGCPFFPVGEARGATQPERVFTLPELSIALSTVTKERVT